MKAREYICLRVVRPIVVDSKDLDMYVKPTLSKFPVKFDNTLYEFNRLHRRISKHFHKQTVCPFFGLLFIEKFSGESQARSIRSGFLYTFLFFSIITFP